MTLGEWIALFLMLAFISVLLAHSSGVVNVENFLTKAGDYLINAVTLNKQSASPFNVVT